MYLDVVTNLKIIKSTKSYGEMIFKEEIYKECLDSENIFEKMKEIETYYMHNPAYEILHKMNDFMSLKVRNRINNQELLYYVSE